MLLLEEIPRSVCLRLKVVWVDVIESEMQEQSTAVMVVELKVATVEL